MTTFDTIIIGKGLFGSAAARYLSHDRQRVAVIGPDEPAEPATHNGVFASHYDQGRLTRQIGRDLVWSALARRAIRHYPFIEEYSGLRFHHPVGTLVIDRPGQTGGYLQDPLATAARFKIPHTVYPAGAAGWRERFPAFDYPPDFQLLYEPGPAGYINPRRLIQAQLSITRQQGGMVIPQTAIRVVEKPGEVVVETDRGERYRAAQLLVAAGAFTNFNNLLPEPIPLRIKTETIILGEVDDETGRRLADLPVVIYQIEDPDLEDIYMTPPTRYPDGRFYFKMGCNTTDDGWPTTLAEVQTWFRHGDSERCRPAMARALQNQLPGVAFNSFQSKRCIVCYTPSGYPTIDRLTDRISVAAGGNGSGAKGSDTVGYLAGRVVTGESWPDDFPRENFCR